MGGAEQIILPAGVLQLDGCVIAEQPEHLVLTLRVPKETILSYLPLMMALAEQSGGSVKCAAPPPPPPVVKKYRAHFAAAGAIVVALILPSPFFSTGIAAISDPPPIKYLTWSMAEPAFKVGEDITVDVTSVRNRLCQTSFDHMISRSKDETPIMSIRNYGTSTPTVGDHTFRIRMRPPSPLPPGEYIYSGYTHSECAQGGAYDQRHPDLKFTVTE